MKTTLSPDVKKQNLSHLPESVGEDEIQTAPSWRQFTQNTTFHGIKYVFDDTTWFRKLFWLLIILGSITFFVVQVGLRIRDYYKYQTVTSVKRMSTDKLQFPAITLCNLNQFRISEAYSMGLYDYFNQQLRTNEEISDPALQGINSTSEVIARLGHQLDRVIDSCKWRGKSCEMSSDFVSRLLDIGLCHTFNHDTENVKFVEQEGMEGGLKVLLNIEVFEHMRGSNLDSGVKILLHQPDEIPSLKNLGFVAAPGQHTFVAIKLSEISSLPAPWGNCVEGRQPVANCKHDCFSEDFIQHCNCSDTSMEKSIEWAECDLPTKLTCGCNKNNKDSSTCGANCTCPDPCREMIFRPSLSSSMLSSINLDMFALQAPGVYERTNAAFLDASETRLRLSPEFDTDFIMPSLGIVESFDTIRHLHTHYILANEDSYISMIKPFGESFYHSINSYDPVTLHKKVEDSVGGQDQCAAETIEADGYINKVVTLVHLVDFMKRLWDEDESQCYNSTNYQDFFEINVNGCTASFYNFYGPCDWIVGNNLHKTHADAFDNDTCIVSWLFGLCCLAGDIHDYIGRIDFDETLPKYLLNEYNSKTNNAYQDRFHNYEDDLDDDDRWDSCNGFVEFLDEDDTIFPMIRSNISILGQAATPIDTFYDFVNDIYDATNVIYNDLKNNTLKRRYETVCCWQNFYLNLIIEQTDAFGTEYIDEGVQKEQKDVDRAIYLFQSLSISEFASDIQSMLLSSVEQSLAPLQGKRDVIEQFTQQPNFTARQLVKEMADPAIARQVAAIITETEREIELLISVQRVLDNIIRYMGEYTMMLEGGTQVNLLHGTNADQTLLLVFLHDQKTKDNYTKFGTPRCNNYTMPEPRSLEIEFYIQIACTFSELVAADIANMSMAVKEFELNYGVLQTTLLSYDDTTQMNQDFYMNNFMQVDLYYETLQYEYIEEQKAFVIGSLFSEVGGFLGLLLGASIITMCELFDHLLLLLGQKLNARKQLQPTNQATNVRKVNVSDKQSVLTQHGPYYKSAW